MAEAVTWSDRRQTSDKLTRMDTAAACATQCRGERSGGAQRHDKKNTKKGTSTQTHGNEDGDGTEESTTKTLNLGDVTWKKHQPKTMVTVGWLAERRR